MDTGAWQATVHGVPKSWCEYQRMSDRFDLEYILSLLKFELKLQQIKHIHPHIVINKKT